MTSYTAKVEYNAADDEYLLELTTEICEELGWSVGDDIEWIDNKDGTFTLRKKDDAKIHSDM